MKKAKVHTLALKVRFDKAVSASNAARIARDCIYGEFHPDEGPAELMKVKSITRQPERAMSRGAE